jgi:hypothetical protein
MELSSFQISLEFMNFEDGRAAAQVNYIFFFSAAPCGQGAHKGVSIVTGVLSWIYYSIAGEWLN